MPKAKNGLTDKQRRFVQEYLVDLNATQAALRAGDAEGKQAAVQGPRLLSNAKIQAALHVRQAEIANSLEVTQERVVAEFAGIGFANIEDLLSWKMELEHLPFSASPDEEAEKVLMSRVRIKDSEEVPRRISAAIQSVEETEKGIKFRLHDKLSALDKLSRFLGLYEKDNTQDINLNAGTDALERMLTLMGEHKEKLEGD